MLSADLSCSIVISWVMSSVMSQRSYHSIAFTVCTSVGGACSLPHGRILMPRTRVVSAITSDMNWNPLSVMRFVGRYAWRVMLSTSTRAMVFASILVTQYVNKYRENTSMAVTIAVYPFDGSSNRTMSICKESSGPIARAEVLFIGGVSNLSSVRLVCLHSMHWLMCLAILDAKPSE